MSTRKDGEVSIQLDKERTLRFGMRGFAAFEAESGRTLGQFFSDLTSPSGRLLGAREVLILLWAGLLHAEPRLTMDQAERLFEAAEGDDFLQKLKYVGPKVMAAVAIAINPASKKKVEEELERGMTAEMLPSGTGRTGNGQPTGSLD